MTLTKLAFVLACATTLAAGCGGGGGGDASNATAPPNGSGASAPLNGSVDTTAPTVSLTAPAPTGTYLNGPVLLTADASDDVGVSAVEFQVDGASVGEDTSAPFSVVIDANNYASGWHVVRARSRDGAGNLSGWSSVMVITWLDLASKVEVDSRFTKNEAWVSNLEDATSLAVAPDGRIFVAERGGTVRIVKNGVLLPEPFLTLPDDGIDAGGERGLIGMTLDPAFAANGYVYLHYTSTGGGAHNRISRFTAVVDSARGGETVLVDLPKLNNVITHNGGAIHFGLDGKLYVGVGDNTESSKSALLTDPFGKLLRFNSDGSIPADNPHYYTQAGLARAIWARGLRNPVTFAVQPVTGRIHINDQGQGPSEDAFHSEMSSWEEINVGAAGANYGWPSFNGPVNNADITAPLFAFKHAPEPVHGYSPDKRLYGFSISGGVFYPADGPFPASYRSNYFFADHVDKFVARLDAANGNAAYTFANLANNPVDMAVGTDGSLYVLGKSAITKITSTP